MEAEGWSQRAICSKVYPQEFEVGRYHSWVVDKNNFPAELEITAEDETGFIMALQHRNYDVQGVQFHPESVLTPNGKPLCVTG